MRKSLPVRWVTLTEAADHCRMSVPTFKAKCPVRPIRQNGRTWVYDIQELDAWMLSGRETEANPWDAGPAR